MNTLELGKYWLSRLCQTLPESSTRMRTRMAWRLAALSVTTDQALAELSDADLTKFGGGSATFLDIREQYVKLRCEGVRLPGKQPDNASVPRRRPLAPQFNMVQGI